MAWASIFWTHKQTRWRLDNDDERWAATGGGAGGKGEELETHLHDVVVEQQPEAVALHDGDVMASVGSAGDAEPWRHQSGLTPALRPDNGHSHGTVHFSCYDNNN